MDTDNTADRIVFSATQTLLKNGVKRSSLSEVAFEAGVTRVTIYRYFKDRPGLIAAVFRHLADIFRRAAEGTPGDSRQDWDVRLKQLGEELGRLPAGSLERFDEIRRSFPAVYEEFRAARELAIDRLFEQAVAAASRERAIREDVNLKVVKAMFRASIVGLIENPALIKANVSVAEICETVTNVLRYGILKNATESEKNNDG
jgi:AcrR family transcriptional regulator